MARKTNGINKSEEVRQLLKANPKMESKEVIAQMAEKGIKVSPGLFYFVKGQINGRKARKTKAQKTVTRVAASTHGSRADAVTIILRTKSLADEVGGMKNLKELVEALSD